MQITNLSSKNINALKNLNSAPVTKSVRVGNTIYSVSTTADSSTSPLFSALYKSKGVTKITHDGRYSTIYLTKHDAQLAVEGAGIVVGGYVGRALGVLLLALVGLGTREAIKGAVWIRLLTIQGTDGLYHTVVVKWGWQ
ncbi:hypothetical protein NIE88_19415 [Sporolactobacillus shoreicorticis]|uniref:Uncharacterized protein n=1 Tax=Sporolactobacillus shoreicorticis TaxID=1923877 RepID=A0ABW5RZX8_9BACL|nr:hypothetical protein [Sporolactobacillus shoreicorticis]MCO7127912.1 hypothetical protein [Sporolactobacillus shoreicorticis]